MSLYLVRKNAPCVMIKRLGYNKRYASFCIDHSMVFETHELIESSKEEYHFSARDGKEYYFNSSDVSLIK